MNGRPYLLATVHRSENTDDPLRLAEILQAFNYSMSRSSFRSIRARAR